jgi:hypothetical protein
MSDLENTAAMRAHRATLVASEGTRQVAIAAAGGSQASIKAADIAHFRRIVASGLTNGVEVGFARAALQELGTGGA